jgi:hypothetical protein
MRRSSNEAVPVVSEVAERVPSREPGPTAESVTTMPLTGLPAESATRTVTAPKVAPAVVLAGCWTKVREAGPAARLVRMKGACPEMPGAVADTE